MYSLMSFKLTASPPKKELGIDSLMKNFSTIRL